MKSSTWKAVIIYLLFMNPMLAFGYVNPAIERELKSKSLSADDRSELMSLRETCSKNTNLKQLKLPRNHDQKSEQFNYWYEYIPASNPTDQTILFIPGGPGGTSIGASFLPENFNVIQIDLRGVGCNFGTAQEFPGETMTTHQAAMDVLRIIEIEGLKQYIIHGHSYGTVAATHLGALLSGAQVQPPTAVVLEGIFGSPTGSWADYMRPRAELIDREMDQDVRKVLTSLEEKNKNLGLFIGSLLSNSFDDDSTTESRKLQDRLKQIRDEKDLLQQFRNEYSEWRLSLKANPIQSSPTNYVLETIECKELTRSYNLQEFRLAFKDGHMQVVKYGPGHEYCTGIQHSGYNSKDHQISSPIYYFQGDRDVSTPVKGAQEHFNLQKMSEQKEFFLFQGRGHNPLQIDLNNCLDKIYLNIFKKDVTALYKTFTNTGMCNP